MRRFLRHILRAEPEIDFSLLAAALRALTAGRRHTPAEVLLREGRDER
ncbi:MAG: hypothetical protein WA417_01510 [Stellaceae bacterium]